MILVSGPMASGTRLLTRLLAASGAPVQHDTDHGYSVWPDRPDHVVAITRNPQITRRSWRAMWNAEGFDPAVSRVLIALRYPDAISVTYEALVADPQATLDMLADRLGLPRWPCPESVYDGNVRWAA